MFESLEGNTPLSPEETQGLLPLHITTQGELNAFEQWNIAQGKQWAHKAIKRPSTVISSIPFIQKLHKHLFDQTWRWAGQFRQSEKNIGVEWFRIPIELKALCDDMVTQAQHESYPLSERAIRFHHRLVWIHPFANGNGRLSRLMADLMMMQEGQPPFSWGLHEASLRAASEVRKNYINALRKADQHDYQDLIRFAHS